MDFGLRGLAKGSISYLSESHNGDREGRGNLIITALESVRSHPQGCRFLKASSEVRGATGDAVVAAELRVAVRERLRLRGRGSDRHLAPREALAPDDVV